MNFAKNAWDSLKSTNSITPRDSAPPLHGASPDAGPQTIGQAPTTTGARPQPASTKAATPAPYLAEPEAIAKAYYVEKADGERRYFDDYKRSNLAMRATDTSVSSKREDLTTIRAMLEIAQARGWQSLDVRGSAEFTREAWIEASARGIEAHG